MPKVGNADESDLCSCDFCSRSTSSQLQRFSFCDADQIAGAAIAKRFWRGHPIGLAQHKILLLCLTKNVADREDYNTHILTLTCQPRGNQCALSRFLGLDLGAMKSGNACNKRRGTGKSHLSPLANPRLTDPLDCARDAASAGS